MKNINMYLCKSVVVCAMIALTGACGEEQVNQEVESNSEISAEADDSAIPAATDEPTESTDSEEETDSETDAAPTEPAVDPIAELVEGWYVYRLQVTTESELPLVGATQSSIFNFGVAEIRKEGEGFVLVARHCRYAMSTAEYFTAEISDAVPASIEPVYSEISFREEGGALAWERAETVVVVGADLADPKRDDLPTDADDERVIDQDNDGHPGVTASVDGLITADVYFVQRQKMSYFGTRTSAGDLMGEIVDASEQNIIGATNSLLDNSSEPTPVPEASSILFLPVERELSCDQLNDSIDVYFGE